jgi:hypothetical protein
LALALLYFKGDYYLKEFIETYKTMVDMALFDGEF